MLVRFFVENYLSFCGRAEFSMQRGSSNKLSNHTIKHKSRNIPTLLKSAVIYGANANGKSNLVRAIKDAVSIILSGGISNHIKVVPFKLSSKTFNQPSTFQFDFVLKNKLYSYGFKIDNEMVYSEWLYLLDMHEEAKDKLIFERILNKGENKFQYDKSFFKETENKFLEFIFKGTPKTALFLKESITRNIPALAGIFNFFLKSFVFTFPDTKHTGKFYFDLLNEENTPLHDIILKFFKLFDIQIEGISTKEIDFDKELDLPTEIKKKIISDHKSMSISKQTGKKKRIGAILSTRPSKFYYIKFKADKIKIYKLMTRHKMLDSHKTVDFELFEESDGTQRIIDILPMLFPLFLPKQDNKIFCIDEIDRSLHPHLTKKIIEFYLNSRTENNQLIITTHESSLLDQNLLRKDEIWFVEKAKSGESHVYSLEEFNPRTEIDIEKGYLQGRFGAIPFLAKNVNDLGWQ